MAPLFPISKSIFEKQHDSCIHHNYYQPSFYLYFSKNMANNIPTPYFLLFILPALLNAIY